MGKSWAGPGLESLPAPGSPQSLSSGPEHSWTCAVPGAAQAGLFWADSGGQPGVFWVPPWGCTSNSLWSLCPACLWHWLSVWQGVGLSVHWSVPMPLLRKPVHPHPPAWLLPSGLLSSAQSWSSVLSFHPTETSVLKPLCLKALQHWACHHQPWADSADRVGCGFSFFGAGRVTGQRVGWDLTEKGGRFPPTEWPQLGEVSWPQLELWTDSNADLSSRRRTLLP